MLQNKIIELKQLTPENPYLRVLQLIIDNRGIASDFALDKITSKEFGNRLTNAIEVIKQSFNLSQKEALIIYFTLKEVLEIVDRLEDPGYFNESFISSSSDLLFKQINEIDEQEYSINKKQLLALLATFPLDDKPFQKAVIDKTLKQFRV